MAGRTKPRGNARRGVALAAVLCVAPVSACTSNSAKQSAAPTSAPSSSSSTASTPVPAAATPAATITAVNAPTANTWTDRVDPTAIPVGDGRVAQAPRVGYVDSCTLSFRGGGATHSGPWLDVPAGMWNMQAKTVVQGSRQWNSASHAFTVEGATRVLTTNDLPDGEPTGNFPIARNDPAYAYDHNPNSVTAQSVTLRVPAAPTAAPAPSCTGLGPIGVTVDGVLLYNALDDGGRDAGAHEIQDSCQGHPDGQGRYHYHSISNCLAPPTANTSILVGYALDGFGIYAERNAQGALPTDADLDACHGRTSPVSWDGKTVTMYHYDVTVEYPYTVGCFHGTPAKTGPPPPR